jgi:hypothetical protein
VGSKGKASRLVAVEIIRQETTIADTNRATLASLSSEVNVPMETHVVICMWTHPL